MQAAVAMQSSCTTAPKEAVPVPVMKHQSSTGVADSDPKLLLIASDQTATPISKLSTVGHAAASVSFAGLASQLQDSGMEEKRETRIKERIARRKEAGKVNRQAYRFLIHQIIPYKDQFVVLGESFYPRYIYANPYGYYGVGVAGSVVRGDRIFDGYRYTHAVIAGFDKNGSLVWDNTFEINDIKTFILEQFVRLDPEADKINLVYMFENNLYTKVISENKVLDGKKEVKVAAKNESDQIKAKTTIKSALEYWYGNNFIASGIQEVSSPRIGAEGGDRKVLFINKVRYQ